MTKSGDPEVSTVNVPESLASLASSAGGGNRSRWSEGEDPPGSNKDTETFSVGLLIRSSGIYSQAYMKEQTLKYRRFSSVA